MAKHRDASQRSKQMIEEMYGFFDDAADLHAHERMLAIEDKEAEAAKQRLAEKKKMRLAASRRRRKRSGLEKRHTLAYTNDHFREEGPLQVDKEVAMSKHVFDTLGGHSLGGKVAMWMALAQEKEFPTVDHFCVLIGSSMHTK